MSPGARPETASSTESTRHRLVQLAAAAFAREGYAGMSVRLLATELGVTTGAIYANFRNKGELLAAVIDERVRHDMEDLPTPVSLPGYVRNVMLHHSERKAMRALFLEAAVAARSDVNVRERLRETHEERLRSWTDDYVTWQRRSNVDPTIDMNVLVRLLWAIELGIGVLEAIDLDRSTPKKRAAIMERFLLALEDSAPPQT